MALTPEQCKALANRKHQYTVMRDTNVANKAHLDAMSAAATKRINKLQAEIDAIAQKQIAGGCIPPLPP